jgi:hypothetical protein
MKQQMYDLEIALMSLSCEMKGKTLGHNQAIDIADMIEEFLVNVRQHIDKSDASAVFKAQSAEMQLDGLQLALSVDNSTQILESAYDRAMKSISKAGDLKYTTSGIK